MPANDIPLRCLCGAVRGTALAVDGGMGNRVVCYCDDCQAFARALGRGSAILNTNGGTDIFQMPVSQVVITTGLQNLRCLRLTSKGLYRWYTDCCKTPIGNTLSAKWPFIGLIHSFIATGPDRGALLGPVRGYLNTRFAIGELPEAERNKSNPPGVFLRITWLLLKWKLHGKNQPSPFFNNQGQVLTEPRVFHVDH